MLQHPAEYKYGALNRPYAWRGAARAWLLPGSLEPSPTSACTSQLYVCTQEAPGHCPAPAGVPAAVHRPAWQTLQGKHSFLFHAQAHSMASKCFAHTVSEPVLQACQHAELDAALEAAASADAPVYVLFPGAGAVSVSEVARASEHRRCLEQASLPVVDARPGPHAAASPGELSRGAGVPDHGCCLPEALESERNCNIAADAVAPGTMSLPAPARAAESPPAHGSRPAYWLIALDGTWQQANEMFQVPPLLGQGCLHIRREHASLAL